MYPTHHRRLPPPRRESHHHQSPNTQARCSHGQEADTGGLGQHRRARVQHALPPRRGSIFLPNRAWDGIAIDDRGLMHSYAREAIWEGVHCGRNRDVGIPDWNQSE